MEMVTAEFTSMVAFMENLVKEYGEDYVNATEDGGTCVYFNEDETPSCGVGHYFAHIGITAAQFSYSENFLPFGTLMATSMLNLVIDDRTRNFLNAFQRVQDRRGQTWGAALAKAKQNDADIFG